MDVKELLGDSYNEEMTTAELLEALNKVELPKPAEPEEPKEPMVSKELFDRKISELVNENKELKKQTSQKMTAEEQANAKIEALEKSLNRMSAEKQLAPLGIEYTEFLDGLLDGGTTDDVVKALAGIVTAVREKAKTDAEVELLKGSPRSDQGPAEAKVDFSKLTTTELMQMASENPGILTELTKK